MAGEMRTCLISLITQNHVYCLVKEQPDVSGRERLLGTWKKYNIIPRDGGKGSANGPKDNNVDLLNKFNKRVTPITGNMKIQSQICTLTWRPVVVPG